MQPQGLVAINVTPAIRIEDLRPILSPNHPHKKDPNTVPVIPDKGSKATGIIPSGFTGDLSPYSLAIPGTTKDKIVGFITSIVIAIAITNSNPICVLLIGASSSARTLKW
jgi:hypothetical protein